MEIVQSNELPPELTLVHREPNLLWYGPSMLLVAQEGDTTLGVIRSALREHPTVRHGFIADLIVNEEVENDVAQRNAIKTALILEAERTLLSQNVTQIDAVVVDGQNLTDPFLKAGYWPLRKTVEVEWDLSKLAEANEVPGVTFEVTPTPDAEELGDFVVRSYQPYWRWWKDEAVEPGEITELLHGFNKTTPQRMVIARRDGRIVGVCDATAAQDDNMEWGVLMTRDHPGKGFGKALFVRAMQWLKSQDFTTARTLATSGIDDYDPTVYLYVESCGGVINGEFISLAKKIAR